MKRSIPIGKERDDFSLSINSIWWIGLFDLKIIPLLAKSNRPFHQILFIDSEKPFLSFPNGIDFFFKYCLLIAKSRPSPFQIVFNNSILMKRSIRFGKERDDFSLSINSIWWKSLFHLERREWLFAFNKQYLMKCLFHLERRGITFRYQ